MKGLFKFLLFTAVLFTCNNLYAQDDKVYDVVEVMPQFPGGDSAMLAFIKSHTIYPKAAADSGIGGKIVIQVTIDKQGKITAPIIARKGNELLNTEALRVVQSMPDWKPGIKNGVHVNVHATIPVTFVYLDTIKVDQSKVYDKAEVMPKYIGGVAALEKYLHDSIVYPLQALVEGAEGTVYTQFCIDTMGDVTNVVAIYPVHPLLDAEALRLMRSMPRWIPATEHGKKVVVYYDMPIKFKISKEYIFLEDEMEEVIDMLQRGFEKRALEMAEHLIKAFPNNWQPYAAHATVACHMGNRNSVCHDLHQMVKNGNKEAAAAYPQYCK